MMQDVHSGKVEVVSTVQAGAVLPRTTMRLQKHAFAEFCASVRCFREGC